MPSFPRCMKCITSTSIDDIGELEIRRTDPCKNHTRYISVRNYERSPVLYSREDALPVAFIDSNFKSILVNIEKDSKLHAILLSIQNKCLQNSPPETQPFLKSTSDGRIQLRLKTQYTKWKKGDNDDTLISTADALSADHRIVLSSWVVEMYRLWRQGDEWHVLWVLTKGRVVEAKVDTKSSTDEVDEIEW